MKLITKLLLCTAMIVVAVSCGKNESSMDIQKKELVKKTSYLPAGVPMDSLYSHYLEVMTAQERYDFWQAKWTYDIANNSFTQDQLDVIEQLSDYIEVGFFDFENNSTFPAGFDTWTEDWKQDATAAGFAFGDQKGLVATGRPYMGGGSDYPPFDPQINCECNREDDWCFGSCESPCELPSQRGCGWFWGVPCNGAC